MPLTNLSYSAQISWSLKKTQGDFASSTQSDVVQWVLTGLNLTAFNQSYAATLTLGASSTTTLDLTGLTNLVNESFGFGHVVGIYVLPTGADVTVGPGASSGLQWMLDDSTAKITVHAGGVWAWSDGSGPGTVVDGTHKNLAFTNLSGAVSASVDVVIFGGTT